jgi:mRNA interferase MazF
VPDARYGEVWLADLDPAIGREQSGRRPVLIISDDLFNSSPAGVVVIVPLTAKDKGIPMHVKASPPEGGLKYTSFIKCEDIRSGAKERLIKRYGSMSSATLEAVNYRLRLLLNL